MPISIQAITSYFAPPPLTDRPEGWANLAGWKKADPDFARWVQQNVQPHKHPDYGIVTVSLKPIGGIPGDASDMPDGCDRRSRRRNTPLMKSASAHEQNLVLPHVALADLEALYRRSRYDWIWRRPMPV